MAAITLKKIQREISKIKEELMRATQLLHVNDVIKFKKITAELKFLADSFDYSNKIDTRKLSELVDKYYYLR